MNDVEKYEAIEALFDKHLRPALMSDGGNIDLDLVKGDEVIISYQGACGSCPSPLGSGWASEHGGGGHHRGRARTFL